jgi:hypothetical protein
MVALQCFWSLKKGIIALDFCSNEACPDLLGSLIIYDYPWEKKLTKNIP